MPTKANYSKGEKLLCYHGPLLYEAKCVDIKENAGEIQYFVHYQGWNKTWDEWVNDSRILKFNEEGLKVQRDLQEEYKESKKKNAKKKLIEKTSVNPKKSLKLSVFDKHASKKIGSASEASNRSVGESEDGRASKITNEDDNYEIKTDAGTSVFSEDLDEELSSNKEKSVVSGKSRGRKRHISPTESPVSRPSQADDRLTTEDSNSTINNVTNGGSAVGSSSLGASMKSKKSRMVLLDESVDLDSYVNGVNVPSFKFAFSEKLKFWLADDWDLITRQSKLTRMPTRLSADDVFNRYKDYCYQEKNDDDVGENELQFSRLREKRIEMADGLKKYFNATIGSTLLYKFERQQYYNAVNQNANKVEMSSTYGPMYVLRLLVNSDKLIMLTKTDLVSVECLSELMQHFIEFLDLNSDEFFKQEDYITASADYTRRAMC